MILHRDIKIKRWKDIKRRRKPGVYTVHRYTVYSTKSIDLKTKLFLLKIRLFVYEGCDDFKTKVGLYTRK